MTTQTEDADQWYENLLWNDKHDYIGQFEHPQHGLYHLWYSDGAYGISKNEIKPMCAYSSLSSLLKAKGF